MDMNPIANRIHATAIRWLYRIIAPGHPRGWIEMHAVHEAGRTGLWVHTHGMDRWGLTDLEIVEVPEDLKGYSHGLLFDILGYMKNVKPIQADETFGGMMVSPDQVVVEHCQFRAAPERKDHERSGPCLRIVDIDEPLESGFPKRLFATRLCAYGRTSNNQEKAIGLLRRSIDLLPGDYSQDPQDLQESGDNPGNYFAWEGLGCLLCETGQEAEGLQCLREAAARWPFAAADYANYVRDCVKEGKLPPPRKSAQSKFWCELDAAENRNRLKGESEINSTR